MTVLHVAGINPEPWTAPEVSIGRKGGKVYPMVYKTDTLRAYQEAISDYFGDVNGDYLIPDDQPFSLSFWFWRNLPSYEIEDGRKSRRHVADATNLQKSLEDALQGVLFKNDRWCQDVRSRIIKQDEDTVPGIVIEIHPMLEIPHPGALVTEARIKILNEANKPKPVDPRAGLDLGDVF